MDAEGRVENLRQTRQDHGIFTPTLLLLDRSMARVRLAIPRWEVSEKDYTA